MDRFGSYDGTALAYHGIGDAEWLTAIKRRSGEPWYAEAFQALMRLDSGEATPGNRRAAAPLSFGRWSASAAESAAADEAQRSLEATAGFRVEGAFGDPMQAREALRDVTAPVLAVGGDLDPAPTPRLLAEFTALFPHGRLAVLPDCGHSAWIDDPALFVAMVNGFLSDWD